MVFLTGFANWMVLFQIKKQKQKTRKETKLPTCGKKGTQIIHRVPSRLLTTCPNPAALGVSWSLVTP